MTASFSVIRSVSCAINCPTDKEKKNIIVSCFIYKSTIFNISTVFFICTVSDISTVFYNLQRDFVCFAMSINKGRAKQLLC